ncbi:hypothetical protein EW026_g7827 [Hermanssonia centrifuga]|uniref:Thioredoxin domain-containing protein n=1 Tax=Hermanssonia centrifuga TaxID=98765 RepID=A0A4S4K895_9APHY|nr:hypothetical protein EW026_g7827 [Hermanssonia centrifuga]
MNLYRDGEFVETFKKSREIDVLREYLTAHAEAGFVARTPELTAAEDRTAAELPLPSKTYNPTGSVSALDETSFEEMIKEGHAFIKFYAPWCGHCKKLAPIWVQLAKQMRDKLNIAEVDCEAHSSICRSQGISGYPMLFYYGGNGSGKTEYSGGRKLEQLKAFAEKVSGPAVQKLKDENLEDEVTAHPVIYLLLHPASDNKPLNQVVEASHVLFGSPPVYVSSSPSLYDRFNVPPSTSLVLAFKDRDFSAPAATYPLSHFSNANDRKDHLSNWLLRNRLPTNMPLDSDSFQEVMNAPHKPLVVIAAASQVDLVRTADTIKEVARRWKDSKAEGDVVFTWMDADKWSSWLKSMYGIKAGSAVHVVVANHSRLVYYDTDQHGEKIKLSANSILSAISGALSGTTPYKHSENIAERLARYLNDKLVAIESLVSHHPWGVTSFILAAVVCIVLFLKRLMSEEYTLADELARKARLD